MPTEKSARPTQYADNGDFFLERTNTSIQPYLQPRIGSTLAKSLVSKFLLDPARRLYMDA